MLTKSVSITLLLITLAAVLAVAGHSRDASTARAAGVGLQEAPLPPELRPVLHDLRPLRPMDGAPAQLAAANTRRVSKSTIFGSDDRVRVGDTTAPGWRSVALLELFDDTDTLQALCSGALLGPGVVLTAAHCVEPEDGSTVASVRVVPGRTGSSAPFGVAWARGSGVPHGWRTTVNPIQRASYDFALVYLDGDPFHGRTAPYLPLVAGTDSYFQPTRFPLTTAGYPGDKDGSMWATSTSDYVMTDFLLLSPMDQWEGQSGSPIWSPDGVVSVVSSGNPQYRCPDDGCASGPPVNFSPRFTQSVVSALQEWCRAEGCAIQARVLGGTPTPTASPSPSPTRTPTATATPSPTPPPAPPAAVTRLVRDRTRQCIPEHPDLQRQCDPARQALWDNRHGELGAWLQAQGKPAGFLDVIVAYLRMHADGGDLDVISRLTKQLAWPNVRTVAVGLSSDPGQEYVEIQDVGGASTNAAGLQVLDANGQHVFTLAQTLAPDQACRVYTRQAGQVDACVGGWNRYNATTLWPAGGAWIRQYYPALSLEADRWYYRASPGGAPAPTPSPSPSPPATPSPTVTPPTPTATPSSTPAPAVMTTRHSTWHVDSIGALWVVGEVYNGLNRPIGYVQVTANLYSASGQLLATDFGFAGLTTMPPHGDAPYAVLVSTAPHGVDHVTVSVTDYTDPPFDKPVVGLRATITNVYTDSIGFRHVVGTVANSSSFTYDYVQPYVALYAASGDVVSVAFAFTQPTTLRPGQTGTFDVSASASGAAVASQRVWVDADYH